ncbi:MAG TPA: DUF362 domain-containing protein [Methanomicrobia archaeon]|nr:DUF362 domain-containing protein [Methanomicrobia archaeon]HEX59289.1 DUF362 domain-containing protein [Methanomicrobia archaeon]
MARVYLLEAQFPEVSGIEKLFSKLDLDLDGKFVAIKVHMGELRNVTYVKPFYVRKVVEMVRECGGEPFVTDTTTLYGLMRADALGYYKVAAAHGFVAEHLGCPVLIADGLRGEDGVLVRIEANAETELKEIEVARLIYESDAMVVVSHATGHGATAFGGALKNVGMGCVTKRGKAAQHEVTKPLFDRERCDGCGRCAKHCAYNAIRDDFEIDMEKCVGCGLCIGLCRQGARFTTREMKESLQRRIAEAACGVLRKFDDVAFLNFLVDVTEACDCAATLPPLCRNIGVLASKDPVAIDKCSIDLIRKAAGRDVFASFDVDPEVQVRHAAALGLGSLEYELVQI